MGTIIVILLVVWMLSRKKRKVKRRNRNGRYGKSDWEKTCDEGGKFFGW